MPSDRPDPDSPPNPALDDTLLAATGPTRISDEPTLVPSEDSSAPAFDLADGEQAVIPVSIDLSTSEERSARYEDGPVLGAGGMGEVRLLRDQRIGRQVAGKTLLGESDTTSRRRFLREARIQGQLEHPAIVPVYDLDEDENGRTFFTMKRVRGLTLSKILDKLHEGDAEAVRRFTRRRLLSAMVQVCHAVHFAHERGVVHRDLKPANLMLGDYGEVYVLDWGVARVLRDTEVEPDKKLPVVLDASAGITRQGDLVGSLGYMAPEQMMGQPSDVDARSDVYSLGIVLFEILTLSKFRAPAPYGVILDRVYQGERQRPRDVRDDVPPELDEICARCTQSSPAARFQSAGELAQAVERYLEGDRDREARQKLAKELVRESRSQLRQAGADAAARTDAMRQIVRALALDPDAPAAQELLIEALVEVKGPTPPEAEAEVDEHVDRLRARGARLGTYGYLTMLVALPLAIWLGVKSWPAVLALTLIDLGCALFCMYASRAGTKPWHSAALAGATGVLVGTVSVIAGPFVAVPALGASLAMYFAAHITASERRIAIAFITLGAAAPFAVEALGWVAPAYAFEPGRIVLFARAVEFPEAPMLLALLYSSVTSVALPAIFTGWIHDERMSVQRRMIVQGWQLRQLFPARTPVPSLPPPA